MFSDRERKIIKIIGRKTTTLKDISLELFEDDVRGFDSSIAVGNCVCRIIKKCEYHKLPWTLTKDRRNRVLTIRREKVS